MWIQLGFGCPTQWNTSPIFFGLVYLLCSENGKSPKQRSNGEDCPSFYKGHITRIPNQCGIFNILDAFWSLFNYLENTWLQFASQVECLGNLNQPRAFAPILFSLATLVCCMWIFLWFGNTCSDILSLLVSS